MSDEPYLGELMLVGFTYPPKGWAFCNGQLLPINQNQALFSLLGTRYGGNAQTTFGLPDLRGRVPAHRGGGLVQGQVLGSEAHTLTPNEMPLHTHAVMASSRNGNQPIPGILAAANDVYRQADTMTTLNPQTIPEVGGSQPHENRQPLLVLNWCIATSGIFPSRA